MTLEVIENKTQTVGIINDVSSLPKTYAEFLEWNGTDGVWAEWVNGEIIFMSNPSLIHQDISDFFNGNSTFFC